MEKRIDKLRAELSKLGLDVQETDVDGWLAFTYNNLSFRFTVDEEQDFMAISLPLYQEHGDVEKATVLEIVNRLNNKVSYIKVIEVGDVFWLTYEVDVESRMPMAEDIMKMILILTGGFYHLTNVYEELAGPMEKSSGEKWNAEEDHIKDVFNWDLFLSEDGGGDGSDAR